VSNPSHRDRKSPLVLTSSFALAGALGCAITHGALTPVDVVKTRIQLSPEVYNKVSIESEQWRRSSAGASLRPGLRRPHIRDARTSRDTGSCAPQRLAICGLWLWLWLRLRLQSSLVLRSRSWLDFPPLELG
jgi:hypothetical protein